MRNDLVDLGAIVQRPEIAKVLLADRPVWLVEVEAGRILFANAAGVAFFGERRLSALLARAFDMRRPGFAELERMSRSLPVDGGARLAMLRFTVGPRQVALPCACSLLPLGDGRVPVLVVATAGAPDRRSLAERATVLFDDLDRAVAIEAHGELVYRNAAADDAPLAGGEAVDLEWHGGRARLAIDGEAPGAESPTPDAEETEAERAPAEEAEAERAPESGAEPADAPRRRFTFALDVAGRFAEVGPALVAAVGPRAGAIEGRVWAEVATDLGLDPDGRLAAALERRAPWDEVLAWPNDAGGSAEVRLAARPRFEDGGAFTGYHGIGDILSVTADAKASPESEPDLPEDENVHPLPPSNRRADGGLSDQERDAFAAIASALGAEDETDAPPTPLARSAPLGAPTPPFRTVVASFMTPPPMFSGAGHRTDAGARPGTPTREESRPAPSDAAAESAPRPAAEPWRDETDAMAGTAAPAAVAGLVERLPIGVAVVRNEAILYANRAFLEVFDYADLDDLEIAGGLAALFEGGRGDGDTVTARRRDGTAITVESTLGRTDWRDGPAMFVTARAAGEPAPPAAEPAEPAPTPSAEAREVAELRGVLDTAADGVLVLAADGTIEAANRSAEALFGRDGDDIVGRPLADLVAPDSRVAVADYLDGLVAGGVKSVLNDGREIVARAHRGGDVPLFLTMGRIGEGDPPRFCAVIRDLTEWKAAEAELVAARKHAEEASAQKSDFLAKMSHEIRTPLNAIVGFAEVILEERLGPIGNERYRDYVRDIRESGTHIMSLVNDLLDLSKIEAGKLELNLAGVNLNDVVEQAVAIMQPEAGRQRVIVRTSLARTLPLVVADQRSLRQVMLNLLSNAVNFTSPGGQAIVSTLVGDDGTVHLRVRDTGVGMSEADIQAALEPFRQLPVRGQEPVRGTGLGLPLTRALVEANRAAFAISSRPNEGTLVEVSFPQSRVLAE